MTDDPDLHTRCSRLVEQANLFSAPSHDIWSGLPNDLALELAVQLSEIHVNGLSVIAWFETAQRERRGDSYCMSRIDSYLDEADRFFATLIKAS